MKEVLCCITSLFIIVSFKIAYADCTKDADCEGDRVCVAGTCVSPGDAVDDKPVIKPDDKDTKDSYKIPSGVEVVNCGCWGYTLMGYPSSMPACESGTATATPCPGSCAAGGVPWRVVCD